VRKNWDKGDFEYKLFYFPLSMFYISLPDLTEKSNGQGVSLTILDDGEYNDFGLLGKWNVHPVFALKSVFVIIKPWPMEGWT